MDNKSMFNEKELVAAYIRKSSIEEVISYFCGYYIMERNANFIGGSYNFDDLRKLFNDLRADYADDTEVTESLPYLFDVGGILRTDLRSFFKEFAGHITGDIYSNVANAVIISKLCGDLVNLPYTIYNPIFICKTKEAYHKLYQWLDARGYTDGSKKLASIEFFGEEKEDMLQYVAELTGGKIVGNKFLFTKNEVAEIDYEISGLKGIDKDLYRIESFGGAEHEFHQEQERIKWTYDDTQERLEEMQKTETERMKEQTEFVRKNREEDDTVSKKRRYEYER